MTSRRATILFLAVLALGGALGLAAAAGIAWMTPAPTVEPFDPRVLVEGLGGRSEARYKQDVDTCRGMASQSAAPIGILECLRRNGYVVNSRR